MAPRQGHSDGSMHPRKPKSGRTLIVSMVGSRCLLSEALTMISSKILYRPGTCFDTEGMNVGAGGLSEKSRTGGWREGGG